MKQLKNLLIKYFCFLLRLFFKDILVYHKSYVNDTLLRPVTMENQRYRHVGKGYFLKINF